MEGKWVIDTGKLSITLWSEIEETEVLGNMFENPNLVVYRFVPTISAFEVQGRTGASIMDNLNELREDYGTVSWKV